MLINDGDVDICYSDTKQKILKFKAKYSIDQMVGNVLNTVKINKIIIFT